MEFTLCCCCPKAASLVQFDLPVLHSSISVFLWLVVSSYPNRHLRGVELAFLPYLCQLIGGLEPDITRLSVLSKGPSRNVTMTLPNQFCWPLSIAILGSKSYRMHGHILLPHSSGSHTTLSTTLLLPLIHRYEHGCAMRFHSGVSLFPNHRTQCPKFMAALWGAQDIQTQDELLGDDGDEHPTC